MYLRPPSTPPEIPITVYNKFHITFFNFFGLTELSTLQEYLIPSVEGVWIFFVTVLYVYRKRPNLITLSTVCMPMIITYIVILESETRNAWKRLHLHNLLHNLNVYNVIHYWLVWYRHKCHNLQSLHAYVMINIEAYKGINMQFYIIMFSKLHSYIDELSTELFA